MERSATLIFCSEGYFASPNCLRELPRAVHERVKVFALLDLNARKGGLSEGHILNRLEAADALYETWGLTHEMDEWGMAKPTPRQLYQRLFEHAPVEWTRTGIHQDVGSV